MNPEQRQLLSLPKFPARLTAEQAAWLLGFQPHDIPILVHVKLLKPLGRPPRNGVKYFSTSQLLTLSQDEHWLDCACDALVRHWRNKSAARKQNPGGFDPAAARRRLRDAPPVLHALQPGFELNSLTPPGR